jgi:hypothetical protein
MEQMIETLEKYIKQLLDSDMQPERKYHLIDSLTDALQELEFVRDTCDRLNIKLGD